MTMKINDEKLFDYAFGELPENEIDGVREYIAQNPLALKKVNQYRFMKQNLKDVPIEKETFADVANLEKEAKNASHQTRIKKRWSFKEFNIGILAGGGFSAAALAGIFFFVFGPLNIHLADLNNQNIEIAALNKQNIEQNKFMMNQNMDLQRKIQDQEKLLKTKKIDLQKQNNKLKNINQSITIAQKNFEQVERKAVAQQEKFNRTMKKAKQANTTSYAAAIQTPGLNTKTYLINKSSGLTLSMEDIINIKNSIQTSFSKTSKQTQYSTVQLGSYSKPTILKIEPFQGQTACLKSYRDYLKIASNPKCQNVILSIDEKNMVINTCQSNENISFICY